MPSIFLTRSLAGAPSDATTVKLKDATNTYGIRRDSDGAVMVPAGTVVPSTVTGDYEYDVSALNGGFSYSAVWEVTVVSGSGTTVRYYTFPFSIDQDVSTPTNLNLMTIEQEVARILGPYEDMVVGSSSSNTLNGAYIPELVSSLGFGGIEDRYMLRRGFKSDGSRIVGFNSDDRVRSVVSVDETLGIAAPDRAWNIAPVATEVIEFHHLHPVRELRKSVLSGLARCYFWDRVSIATTTAAQEINVTTLLPWLKDADLIRRVEAQSIFSTIFAPTAVREYRPFHSGGSVYLRMNDSPYPQNVIITFLRPANSYINNAISLRPPDDDEDIIPLDLDYAVAAGHIEAWRFVRRKLQPVAQTGLFPTRAEAAATFTQKSQAVFHAQSEPDFPRLQWDYRNYGATS